MTAELPTVKENLSYLLPEDRVRGAADKIFREDFSAFCARAFRELHPGGRYAHAPYLDLLAAELRALMEGGQPSRLLINMPPRCLKTFAVSVCWPAWLLGRNPALKILTASYAESIAERSASDCRALMESEWYRTLFPATRLLRGDNRRSAFLTQDRGGRRSVSVGGAITGEGGDVLILDDPHNAAEIGSVRKRAFVKEWFEKAFLTRMNDPARCAIALVMQRLSRDDLTAHVAGTQGELWRRLRLPALAEEDMVFWEDDPVRRFVWHKGEPLAPERLGYDALHALRLSIGEAGFRAQYMQDPQASENAALNRSHFREHTAPPPAGFDLHSWDTAFHTGPRADYSVCVSIRWHENVFYVTDLFRARVEYADLLAEASRRYERERPRRIYVENKASGQILLQDLRRAGAPVFAVNPARSKTARLLSVLHVFEQGGVSLPKRAAWKADMLEEMLSFPETEHDDCVDALVQAITCILGAAGREARLREA